MATQTQVLKRGAVQPARLHDYLYGELRLQSYMHRSGNKNFVF